MEDLTLLIIAVSVGIIVCLMYSFTKFEHTTFSKLPPHIEIKAFRVARK